MTRAVAKLHEVHLTATKDGGRYRFDPDCSLWDDGGGSLHFHKDHHDLRKKDYHLVEFVLDDQTGDGLSFARVPHDAMWVTRAADSGDCPTAGSSSDYEVIEPLSVSEDGRRLIVRNDNPRHERWAFALNFTRRGADPSASAAHVTWDPIIDNHNGGS